MPKPSSQVILGTGKFLRLVRDGRWEFAQRINSKCGVAIVAITEEREYILTDQFRPAVGRRVIDLPAGLSGDIKGQEDEAAAISASRELVEETGYQAEEMEHLADCPSSPGLASEVISYFYAHRVTRVSDGGGVEHEQIDVWTPKIRSIKKWLADQVAHGKLIDPKVYAGLYFIRDISRRR